MTVSGNESVRDEVVSSAVVLGSLLQDDTDAYQNLMWILALVMTRDEVTEYIDRVSKLWLTVGEVERQRDMDA